MKNLRSLVLILSAGALILSACGKKSGTGSADNGTNRVKIGFLLKTMQEERYQRDKAAFEAEAQKLGFDVVFDSANNNEQTQMALFENMLVQGVKVIVLQPVNTGTAGNMVKMAHDAGVRVVGYDSMLVNGPLDAMVMQDSWAVGRLQAQAMVDWLMKKKGKVEGRVVLVRGQPGDSNAKMMSQGVLEVISNNPGLQLVADQSHEGWSAEKAMATAENVLMKYNNQIDAFICNNSGMARGVISALEAQGLADANKVFVAGSDADLVNIQYVAQGKQAVEIWKKIEPLAQTAADVAYALATHPNDAVSSIVHVDRVENNGYQDVPTIVTPIVLITRDNIDSTLIAAGFYSRDQIYGTH